MRVRAAASGKNRQHGCGARFGEARVTFKERLRRITLTRHPTLGRMTSMRAPAFLVPKVRNGLRELSPELLMAFHGPCSKPIGRESPADASAATASCSPSLMSTAASNPCHDRRASRSDCHEGARPLASPSQAEAIGNHALAQCHTNIKDHEFAETAASVECMEIALDDSLVLRAANVFTGL